MGTQARRGRPDGVVLHGELVRDRRSELGLSQSGLADLCRLGVRTVRTAEAGQPVSPDTAKLLATSLGLAFVEVLRPSARLVRDRLEAGGLAPIPPRDAWVPIPELLVLQGLLDGPPSVIAVEGPRGIGKATLVRQVLAERPDAHPDGVIWADASQLGVPERLVKLRLEIADCLGFVGRLPDPAIVSAEAFDRAFALQLWRGDRVLVLDDLDEPDLLRAFTEGAPSARVIVTTRRRWVADQLAAHRLALEAWPDDRVRALLDGLVGAERFARDPEGTRAVLELVGGLPLYARLAGAGLQRARHRTLSDYTAEVRGEVARPQEGARDPMVRGLLDSVAKTLGPGALQAVRDLALVGGASFQEDFALTVIDGTPVGVRAVLDELSDAYLLHRAEHVEGVERFRVARWAVGVWGDPSDGALSRVLATAPERVERWIAGRAYGEAFEVLRVMAPGVREVFRRILARFPDLEGPARSPADLPSPPDPLPGLERLPATVIALAPLFRFAPPDEGGAWASAALAVAQDDGERASLGWLLAWWWHLRGDDPRAACVWADHAVQVEPDPDRAASLALHACVLQRLLAGHRGAAPDVRRLLAGIANGPSSRTFRACAALQRAADALFGDPSGARPQDASAHLDAAMAALGDEPGLRADVLRAVATMNGAVLGLAQGLPVGGEPVSAAVRTLLAVIRPDPLLLAAIDELVRAAGGPSVVGDIPDVAAHFLGLSAHAGEGALPNLVHLLAQLGAPGLSLPDEHVDLPGVGPVACVEIAGSPLAVRPATCFPLFLPLGAVRRRIVEGRPALERYVTAIRGPDHPALSALFALGT